MPERIRVFFFCVARPSCIIIHIGASKSQAYTIFLGNGGVTVCDTEGSSTAHAKKGLMQTQWHHVTAASRITRTLVRIYICEKQDNLCTVFSKRL
jgi:hypothetical protein